MSRAPGARAAAYPAGVTQGRAAAADPARPPTTADGFARMTPTLTRIGTSVLVVALLLPAFLSRAGGTMRARPLRVAAETFQVMVWRPWPWVLLFAVATAALAAAVVVSRRRELAWRPYTVVAVAALVVAPVAYARRTWRQLERMSAGPPVALADGTRYRVVRTTEDRWIAREDDADTFRILLVGVGRSSEDDWGTGLVRPRGRGGVGGLYPGPDGRLYDLSADGRCRGCLDPELAPSQRQLDDPAWTLRGISPFVLLGPFDEGDESDLHALETSLRRGGAFLPPDERRLLEALGASNPWVRDAARRLIRAGGPVLYPHATKRL